MSDDLAKPVNEVSIRPKALQAEVFPTVPTRFHRRANLSKIQVDSRDYNQIFVHSG